MMKAQSFSAGLGGLIAVLALGMSSSASAAGTARVSTMGNDGKRVLANVDFTGPGNLRASAVLPGRPTLIVRDGRAFVTVDGTEQALADAASANAAGVTRPNTGDEAITSLASLKNTGRKEERAGFVGDIYEMSFYDRDNRRRTEQIVVSNDPRARELTDLWKSVNDALLANGIPEAGDLQKQLQANGLDLLRFSFRYQVDRLDHAVRLPPVQATAPVPAPAVPALAEAAVTPPPASPPPAAEPALGERVRRFTQGSLFGLLFGSS